MTDTSYTIIRNHLNATAKKYKVYLTDKDQKILETDLAIVLGHLESLRKTADRAQRSVEKQGGLL